MRSLMTVAAACLAVSVATPAGAQAGRPFRDSWFWGVHGGVMTYTPSNQTDPTLPGSSSIAPIIGADWLITRTKGGLYLSFGQAFLSTGSSIQGGPSAADANTPFDVEVENLRRLDLVVMAFPGDYIRWHPYLGFGFSFRSLGFAQATGPFATDNVTRQKQVDYAAATVNDFKATIGPAFIAGGQFRLKRISAFAQFLASTTSQDFLLANGHTLSVSTEFGFRYNIGSSIDR
jgi:hypothetical protein